VANRFAGGESGSGRGQDSWFVADGAEGTAVGTALLLAEGLGLLLQEGGESALGQASSGSAGNLLHQVEIDVQSGAVLAEGSSSDDFAPAGGEGANFLKDLGGKVAMRHNESCLVLAGEAWE